MRTVKAITELCCHEKQSQGWERVGVKHNFLSCLIASKLLQIVHDARSACANALQLL